jgi:hypothetical protein
MYQWLNKMVDRLSDYLAQRKGLLPFIGLILIIANLCLQFTVSGWVQASNLLLHIGLIIAILGLMLAWAL